ncbi:MULTISPECIES: hypothetical protein [unclassified Bacillus (in: firmicutes)]|uniref:hypothetical protein n=1 Tax=unclassified Bacillus (in: firmicutes) TaxID=185979 RepID=UPI0015969515|nr:MULTISPECIES: hypothetical protein [unclassified Bacillus (in: firmicutes)]
MEENIKLFGEDGMLQMEFKNKNIGVYDIAGYLMETITTKDQVQEVIDFLEECKECME